MFLKKLQKESLFIAWIIATAGTLGSLYFSEIAGFPPCILCWYQRTCLYPLVLIILIGTIKKDQFVHSYILPLASIGWIIALYHNLLYYKMIPESIKPCALGISCTTQYIEWFGFVTIPLLSLLAFTTIIALTIFHKRGVK